MVDRLMKRTVLISLLALVALVGCGEGPADNPPATVITPEMIDAQIAKVKADPNLSEEAKQGAIRGIEMGRQMSQQGGQGSGKPAGK